MRRGDGEFGVKPLRTYASSFILSLAFATALVLPWAVSRRLRLVALSGSMSIAACQIPSALLYVEPPPPIAIVGLPSCEMRSQMRSHNGPPRGIHSYLCEMETVGIKPFLRFPNS